MKTATTATTGKPSASPAVLVAMSSLVPSPVESAGSNEQSASPEAEVLSSTLTQTYEPSRQKILCNPSADEVYRRERGSPWRVDVDEKLRLANLGEGGTAREASLGTRQLSTLLKTGIALKMAQQQQQQEAGGAGKPTELGSHEVAYVQLLAAAEKYDLKQVVMLPDKFPKGRNANGNSSPKCKLTKC